MVLVTTTAHVGCGTEVLGGSDGDAATSASKPDARVPETDAGHARDGGSAAVLLSATTDYLAVDDTSLYWTEVDDTTTGVGRVMSAPVAGGAPTAVAEAQTSPGPIAVDSSNLYWLNESGPAQVLKMAKTGGTITTLATTNLSPLSIAVDAANVYYIEYDGSDVIDVVAVPLAGGSTSTLATAHPGGAASSLATDGQHVFWSSTLSATLYSVPVGGGTNTTLLDGASTGNAVDGIAVDDANIYFSSNSSVISMPKAGGTLTTLTTAATATGALLVDATNVYWVASAKDAVVSLPKSGGAPSTVGSFALSYVDGGAYGPVQANVVGGFVVGATNVFWSEIYPSLGTLAPPNTETGTIFTAIK